tara:strand:+ start:598 stop:918 length:321 start_codon:yes stop_codon:yes gene_type:complete
MSFWSSIIGAVMPVVVDMFVGSDEPAQGQSTEGGMPNLVAKPEKPTLKSKKPDPFNPSGAFNVSSRDYSAGIKGAVPSLDSAHPSSVESQYWAALLKDAKRKSEVA